MFWDERGGGLTPVGPQVDIATIRTVMGTNRVDLVSFSSRCCAFRRTHTSADPIRLLCIRLALPLALPSSSGFVPSAARLVICVSARAPWPVCYVSCICMFWEKRGGELTSLGPQVDTATISTDRVDEVLAHDDVRPGVHTRAQTPFGYFVSD